MRRRLILGPVLGGVWVVAALGGSAMAATGLTSADTNHDGRISRAEAEAAQDKAFRKLDRNHDGVLDFSEFAAGQPGLPPHPTEADRARRNRILHQWFRQLDRNHDGHISRDEYEQAVMPYFNRLDTNHDGYISARELGAALGQMPGSSQK